MITRRAFLPVLGVPALGVIPLNRRFREKIPPRPPETRLLFGGDVMLSRFVGKIARERHDPASPLRDLAPVLRGADLAFVNLEAPFSDRGHVVESGMVFKAEPEMIEALQTAGIAIVSTANNHARDCAGYGVEFTLDWLAGHGIATVGTAKTPELAHQGTVLERNGIRFGFLAYTYDQSNGNHKDVDLRVPVMDTAQMRDDVRNLRLRADVAIVSMHAGIEYSPLPNTQQKEFAHAAIDAGARLVVGHHPHVTQPWEKYGSGVIFYSLGNLVFDQFQRAETQRGLLAEATFFGKALVHAGVIPVDIVRTVPRLAA
ncbi:MAG TPA: CapA family protein [Bryobacteraceae bacterium]|jgi:poly-gamma-glutamate synthesis protein (capsule biosynthesis protein)